MDKEETIPEDPKKSPKKGIASELNVSISNEEIALEPINHLSNVQMLSEQTPRKFLGKVWQSVVFKMCLWVREILRGTF